MIPESLPMLRRKGPAGNMFYICPDSRYVYESPKGVANALGERRKSGESLIPKP